MISVDQISSLPKEDIPSISETLTPDDIRLLVNLLEEKDDKIRYPSFLLLKSRSEKSHDVYPYWDNFVRKFNHPNSFIRNIGVILIAVNVRWDRENKFKSIINNYLEFVNDEKPVTVRQFIQNLRYVVEARPEYGEQICGKLLAIDISQRKESQQKLVLLDILSVFLIARKHMKNENVEKYILDALTGGLLDKKSKMDIQNRLEQ